MLNLYQRRAFLLFALIAFEPAATGMARASEPETLWDVLVRIDNTTRAARAEQDLGLNGSSGSARCPLGVLPGFTLPAASGDGEASGAALIGRKKRHGGPFGQVSDWLARMEAATGTSIKAKGSSTFTFQANSVSGGSQATSSYQSDQYFGQGSNGFYNDTNLDIDATLFRSFHYHTHISNYLYNRPDENKVQMDYKSKTLRVEAGDINAGFQGNSLINFNRYVSGVMVTGNVTPKMRTSVLFSQTKATPQTRTIQGADSAGPYFVYSGQIVDGSAQVRVDNRLMQQGKDYTLDQYTGELNFLNGIIIPHTSTIAVSYESLGDTQQRGSIYGLRTDYALHGGTHVGFTYLTQLSQGGVGAQTLENDLPGTGLPLSTYTVDQPIDTTKPISVTIGKNGVPLVYSKIAGAGDFWVDPQVPNMIHVKPAVPPSPAPPLVIVYSPVDPNPTPGNRNVMGFDGSFAMGRIGTLTLETAMSGISLTGNSVSGKAALLRADLTPAKNLHTNIILKAIGSTFTGIESAGFNSNEKSIELSSDYTPFKRLHLNGDWLFAKRPSYINSSVGNAFTVNTAGYDTYNQYSMGLSYDISKHASLSYNRQSMSTRYVVGGGDSANLSDNLLLHYTLGTVSLEGGLTRNNSSTNSIYNLAGTDTTSSSSQLYSQSSSTFSKHIGLNWNPKNWFRLNATVSDNTITNSGAGVATGTSTTGLPSKYDARDAQLTASFNLKRGISIEYGYTLSDTGNLGNLLGSTSTTGSTGGTSSGSTGTSGGVTQSRAFFAPWTFPVLRDASSSGIGSSSSVGFGGYNPGVYGGGTNYNLGSAGNYSGFLPGSSTYSSGLTSLAGRSATNRISIGFSPNSKMHTALSLLTSSSIGDYQYNSNNRNLTFNFDWTPSNRFRFDLVYNVQKVAYNGTLGGSNSNALTFDLEGHPFGSKLNARLSWQILRTKSALNLSGTGSTTGTSSTGTSTGLTDTSSNVSGLLLHLDYPISSRQSLFLDINNSITTGYLGNSENDIRFGMQFRIMQPLSFNLGWELVGRNNKDTSLAAYNYHSSSLLAQLGLQF